MKNAMGKATPGARKVGLQAMTRAQGFRAGGSITSLPPPPSGCSSALSDTAFPWKAEVILPLQGAPQRRASPFPSLGVNIYRKSEVPPRTKHQADWTWLFQVEAK